LTMNCTRCHDHKYDPVTQQEYYELIAMFQPAYDPQKWIPGMVNQFGAGPVRAIPIADRKGREEFQRRMEELGRQNAELSYQKENGIPNKYRDRYIREHLDEVPASFDHGLIEQALTREERQRGKEEKAAVFAVAKHFNLGPERLKKLFPQMIAEQKENQRQQKELAAKGTQVGEVIWALWDVSTNPTPARLLTRGEFKKPAHEVQPGILRALDRAGEPWQPPAPDPSRQTTGRRLAFADWVVHPDHPLTARVMVNRVWQYHFGTGLVATPDDFGTRGAKPSHPELLDWLALEFIESGWSIKHLHRLILNSTTYRQSGKVVNDQWSVVTKDALTSGAPTSDALASDAFPRRRLEAEAIRDAMLHVSGLLDRTMFGESIPTEAGGDGSFDLPATHPGRRRRSVYLSTRRTQLPTFLTLFDAPSMDTNWPRRNDSAIAPQALALMNHGFVLECADAFAGRILESRKKTAERIDFAFRLAYGRPPQPDEQELFGTLLAKTGAGDERDAWRTIAHALLASSEFLYVD
ncbi:MAG: DUF1549 and DUF1553 domain-containing protein, partial [Verrucomicrobiota bacterium]|nr:DUF1549 and DUF1553 domain-containing protein [Verrucomicrobiota bacterium]